MQGEGNLLLVIKIGSLGKKIPAEKKEKCHSQQSCENHNYFLEHPGKVLK